MMNKVSPFLLLIILLVNSCKKEINYSDLQKEDIESAEFDPAKMEIADDDDVQIYLDKTGEYPDGSYCADVEYYNPNTETRSTYNLNVEVQNGNLVQLDWPNGGWLDSTHFSPESISTGEVSFTSDRGYIYTVTLNTFGGSCSDNGYQLMNTVNNDVQQEIQQLEQERQEERERLQALEQRISIANNISRTSFTGSAFETQIDGPFEGWDGETIFKMRDGTIWQQDSYDYRYHYAYAPDVLIYRKNGSNYMRVEGVDDEIRVIRIK